LKEQFGKQDLDSDGIPPDQIEKFKSFVELANTKHTERSYGPVIKMAIDDDGKEWTTYFEGLCAYSEKPGVFIEDFFEFEKDLSE